MVRHYKRKTRRGDYGVDNINSAVAKVRSGEMSKRKAEVVYGVPRKTLTRHLQGLVKCPGTLGRFKTVLNVEFEKALTEHAVHLQQMLFGLTTADFRKLAFDVAEKLNIEHPFNKENKKAGRDWLSGFLNRHPELAVRHPEPTSMSRAVGFNKPSVDKFFNILKAELQKNNVTADRLWNADETGLTVVHRPGKIMAKSGVKQVGKITSAERGETVTVMCAVNGAGAYVPPLMIFKRRRMTELLLKGSPPGTIGAVTDNGWIDGSVFLKWLKHFVLHVKPSAENKVILVVDGHATHKSLAAIEYARDNSVIMISLPPHSTHHMQPLDKTIFGPLKTAYNAACDKWMVSHPGRRISTYDQAELFCEAYLKAASMRNAISGFASCGLWPFNPDIFQDMHFAPSMITDEPNPAVPQSTQLSVAEANTSRAEGSMTPQSGQPSAIAADQPMTPQAQDPTMQQSSQPSGSGGDQCETSRAEGSMTPQSGQPSAIEADQPMTPQAQDPTMQQSSHSRLPRNVIADISPLPKAEKSRARKRRVESAELLTGSPYKTMLLNKMCKTTKPDKTPKMQTKSKTKLEPKKKKKLTCRQDKPRGRRPKQQGSTKVDKKKSANSSHMLKSPKNGAAAREKKNSADVKSPSKCNGCGIFENSTQDLQMNRGWIACESCGLWFHDSCGEEYGVFDDDYFYCISCVD